jgi:hypothetical protein
MKSVLLPPWLAFAAAAAMFSSGCGSYPQGITKAEWDQMSAAQRSRIVSDEAKRTRKVQESYPKDGQVLSRAIRDDQQTRERAPELVGR